VRLGVDRNGDGAWDGGQDLASRSGAAFLAVMIDDRGADSRHDRHLLQA